MSNAELSAPWMDADGVPVYNFAGDIDNSALRSKMREVASSLNEWHKSNSEGVDYFTVPKGSQYQVFRAARSAQRDDVVDGVLEGVTALATNGRVRWGGDDSDLANGMDDICRNAGLWPLIPQMFRELSLFGQTVVAVDWGSFENTRVSTNKSSRKTYRVRGIRKIATLDPLCVVPFNLDIFGGESLGWHVDPIKAQELRSGGGFAFGRSIFKGFVDPRKVSMSEHGRLARLGVAVENLIELDPNSVFRLSLPKGAYERFAPSPLESVFPLLSQKAELRAADGVALRGTANYILLVRQGSDNHPARQIEIDTLRRDFQTLAKVPIIVSDHRLQVEILTPSTQYTLQAERYDVLDRRILTRMLSSLFHGGDKSDTDAQLSAQVISQSLGRRRQVIGDFLEKLAREHMFEGEAPNVKLEFTPRQVPVDNGSFLASAMQNARDRHVISRQTFHEHFGFDQETEAERVKREKERFDDVFEESVPFNSPDNNTGRPVGGGDPSANDAKPRTSGGSSKKEK